MSQLALLTARLAGGDYSLTQMPDGSGVLLDLHQEVLLNFNASGAFMAACVVDGVAPEEIARRVVARFDVDAATANEDVTRFVAALAQAVGV